MNASANAAPTSDLDRVLHAVGDPTRRATLRLVREREIAAGEIAARFPAISRPAVSQHLRVLADAGLVTVRRDGNRRLYRARTEALAPVSTFIDEMWSDRLRDLKRVAEAQKELR